MIRDWVIYLRVRAATLIATPPAGQTVLFADALDGHVKAKTSAGEVVDFQEDAQKAPAGSVTIAAGGSAYISDTFEVASGKTLEILSGGTLEIG